MGQIVAKNVSRKKTTDFLNKYIEIVYIIYEI